MKIKLTPEQQALWDAFEAARAAVQVENTEENRQRVRDASWAYSAVAPVAKTRVPACRVGRRQAAERRAMYKAR